MYKDQTAKLRLDQGETRTVKIGRGYIMLSVADSLQTVQ
jgi:hypothetical protein